MGSSTEQARAQVAATRGRLDASFDRLEVRLREELDVRRRLRRDGARLAAGAAVVVAVAVVYAVRRRRQRGEEPDQNWLEAMPDEWRQRLQELLAEAAAQGRLEGAHPRRTSGRRPVWQSLALRGVRMGAPVVMSAVGERLAARRTPVNPT